MTTKATAAAVKKKREAVCWCCEAVEPCNCGAIRNGCGRCMRCVAPRCASRCFCAVPKLWPQPPKEHCFCCKVAYDIGERKPCVCGTEREGCHACSHCLHKECADSCKCGKPVTAADVAAQAVERVMRQ